ncbi:recombination protein NinG, partial [Pseudomonas aeruginosa]|nr:recombination protein NinG [Pseudomonas aeruginosa]
VDYRVGLIARIGLAAVEELEADNSVRKYTVEDLKAIKAHYRAKVRELKKRIA